MSKRIYRKHTEVNPMPSRDMSLLQWAMSYWLQEQDDYFRQLATSVISGDDGKLIIVLDFRKLTNEQLSELSERISYDE